MFTGCRNPRHFRYFIKAIQGILEYLYIFAALIFTNYTRILCSKIITFSITRENMYQHKVCVLKSLQNLRSKEKCHGCNMRVQFMHQRLLTTLTTACAVRMRGGGNIVCEWETCSVHDNYTVFVVKGEQNVRHLPLKIFAPSFLE